MYGSVNEGSIRYQIYRKDHLIGELPIKENNDPIPMVRDSETKGNCSPSLNI